MTKPKLTKFIGEAEFSDNQRRLGPQLYNNDHDMKLRKYTNGKPSTVAIFEAKHGLSKVINLNDSNIVSDRIMCDEEFKVPVPHFIVVYYLKPSFEIPMYLVIGNNKAARNSIKQFNNGNTKFWFTEEQYSRFQYYLIGKTWNPDCILSNQDVRYSKPEFKIGSTTNT